MMKHLHMKFYQQFDETINVILPLFATAIQIIKKYLIKWNFLHPNPLIWAKTDISFIDTALVAAPWTFESRCICARDAPTDTWCSSYLPGCVHARRAACVKSCEWVVLTCRATPSLKSSALLGVDESSLDLIGWFGHSVFFLNRSWQAFMNSVKICTKKNVNSLCIW